MISCKDGFDFRGAEIAVSESIHHRLSNSQNESADPRVMAVINKSKTLLLVAVVVVVGVAVAVEFKE